MKNKLKFRAMIVASIVVGFVIIAKLGKYLLIILGYG